MQLEDPQSEITEITLSAGFGRNDQSVLSSTVVTLGDNSNFVQTSVLTLYEMTTTVQINVVNFAGLETITFVSFRSGRGSLSFNLEGGINVYSNTGDGEFAKCLCNTDVVTVSVELIGIHSCVR